MKCRKLYKIENNKNNNIVFFKSKGTRFPSNIYCVVSESDGDKLFSYGTQKIFPVFTEKGKHSVTFYNVDTRLELTLEFEFNNDFDSNLSQEKLANCKIENLEIICEQSASMRDKTFYISFYSEEIKTSIDKNSKEIKETKKYIIFQDDFKLSPTGENLWTHPFKDPIEYKSFCLAIKVDDNYGDKQEAVAYSLTQRLSILKGELWYMINYGLPLLDKVRSGAIFDSVIINIILSHPDVTTILQFSSSVENHSHYKFNAIISTIYNIDIEIGNSY